MLERILRTFVLPVAAVAVSVIIGMIFLRIAGYPALGTFRAILQQCFGDAVGFGQVLRAATLLTFTGLAVALAFHAGLFNIGVEGQLIIGSVAIGIAGSYLVPVSSTTLQSIPRPAIIAFLAIIGMVGGALWAAVPGILKAVTGAHEVITTIMMNFVAAGFVVWLLRPDPRSFAIPATQHTARIPDHARMPLLSKSFPALQGSQLNWTIALAMLSAVLLWLFLYKTRTGFGLRAVGKNPDAAKLAGVNPRGVTILAMVISGALAGLVGVDSVLGEKGYFEEGFSSGIGFLGIAVALLANNHPIGVLATAFLFGVLSYAKVAAAGQVPKDIIEILQATVIIAVLLGNRILARFLLRMKKRRAANPESGATLNTPDAPPAPLTSPSRATGV